MDRILGFLLAIGLGLIFIRPLRDMLAKTILLSKNFKGEDIANGMGIGFVFSQVISLGIIDYLYGVNDLDLYLLGLVFIGFLGLLDDSLGTDEYKGFKGHIGAFFKGKLTSGNLKAILGFFISLYIASKFSYGLMELLINSLLMALSINMMNLFDLRPGRAIKVFLIIALPMLAFHIASSDAVILLSLIGFLIVYMRYDLKALSMMGDTGSNILGYSLAYYMVANLDLTIRMVSLFIVVFINVISEKKSISKIIASNKVLNYIDMLGR